MLNHMKTLLRAREKAVVPNDERVCTDVNFDCSVEETDIEEHRGLQLQNYRKQFLQPDKGRLE
jgi:hypothetical protein